ncbi:MAG TPA: hypothetical protein VG982_01085 [Candidatus Paceibacterota bacterium]|nr:hypothetical protein [Candidatus Paceibacterota bacterium]
MEATICVHNSKGEQFLFSFLLHESNALEEQKIEKEFYEQWSLSRICPEGVHYEAEILHPDVVAHEKGKYIHYHVSKKNQKVFVCWTDTVPDRSTLAGMLKTWTAGTVYTMETGKPFAGYCMERGVDPNEFEKVQALLRDQCGIAHWFSNFNFTLTENE